MLVEESKLKPPKNSCVYAELRIYKTDTKAYKPYISPHNSDSTLKLQKVKDETKKLKKKSKKSKEHKELLNHRTKTEQEIFEERCKKIKNYIPELGEITGTKTYTKLINLGWNCDYVGLSGASSFSIPFLKEDLKQVHKGAKCSIHVKRIHLGEDINKMKQKDVIKLKEVKDKVKLIEKKQKSPKNNMVKDSVFIDYKEELETVFYGFVDDINFKESVLEIKGADYSKALQQEDIMTFKQMKRSDILKEIIKSSGMIPMIDTTGLRDDVIDWTSAKSGSEKTESSPLLGDDCTESHSMSVTHSGSHGNAGTGKNWDSQAKKGYAKKDSNYYKWATQFKNGEAMLKALRKLWKYHGYRDNRTCPQKLFNTSHFSSNCADAARLVKVCCDSMGFPCVVIHGSIYAGGHYWNAIKVGGGWKTFDLCYANRRGDTGGTNTSNIF